MKMCHRYFPFLEMAFETERRAAFVQQPLVDRSVRRMASGATLTHRFMFIDERAALLRCDIQSTFRFGS